MSGQSMADVLAGHGEWRYTNGAGSAIVCRECGEPVENVTAHQAAALSAAGFGPVQEAKADAWDECEAAKYVIRLNAGSNSWGAVKDNPYRKDQP